MMIMTKKIVIKMTQNKKMTLIMILKKRIIKKMNRNKTLTLKMIMLKMMMNKIKMFQKEGGLMVQRELLEQFRVKYKMLRAI